MAVADPVRGVRALLLADAGVSALVGTRVYTGRVVTSDLSLDSDGLPTVAALVVNQSGGLGQTGYGPVVTIRVDVRAYGPSEAQTRALWWEARRALKSLRPTVITNIALHTATPEAGPVTGIEPGPGGWPVTWGSFLVRAQEELAA